MSESLEGVIAEASVPAADIKLEAVEGKESEVKSEVEETKEVTETNETEQAEEKKLTKAEMVEKKLESTKAAMQKRIDRQTASRKALEEKTRALEEQLKSVQPKEVDNSPKEDNYESWEDFQKATIEYEADKLVNERMREQKNQELASMQQKQLEEGRRVFEGRENEFRAATPDYDDKAAQFQEIAAELVSQKGEGNPTLEAISNVLMESEVSPKLIYELGNNPDLAYDLANMNPIQAAREIFKMELSFSNGAKKEDITPPKPIKPIGGKGSSSKSLDNMSSKDLLGWINS